MHVREKGLALLGVVIVVVIFVITGMAALILAEQEIIVGRIDVDKTKAFYLAEAGLAKMQEKLQKPVAGKVSSVLEESLEDGSFKVVLDTSKNPCYAISTGISGNAEKTIRVRVAFLALPLEKAIYAMNEGGNPWAFQLRGNGKPVSGGSGGESGGKDVVNGNIFVNGDAGFYEESSINPAPAPNKWSLNGDVGATGNISLHDSAKISGASNPYSEEPATVDLVSMDYTNNNTHDVAKIFQDAGVSSGYLPVGSELRDVFVKNPSDRSAECAITAGNDYFFEPSSGFVAGTPKTGQTKIDAGENRIYYVDGDVWIHSKPTYGFKMSGKVTIVATGDIHICDNLEYQDSKSILGLVALGKYNSSGNLVGGGNIFFGDPRYGTMYSVSGMMFAAKDFLYNTDAVSRKTAEPTTGFTINGNFAAMDKVTVERDWYTQGSGRSSTTRPAHYDAVSGKWVDSETGAALTLSEVGTMRHYQMIVNYDERVRNPETQPPGLPLGGAKIFAGFSNWEEL